MSIKFKHKDIYKDNKASFLLWFSLLNLELMSVRTQDTFMHRKTLLGPNGLIAFFLGIFLISLSLEGNAQCKKSTSTCNLTTLRAAFTAKGFQELGCGSDSCSIYFIDPTARTNSDADSVARSLGSNLVSFQNIASNDSVVKWANGSGFSGSVWTGFNDKNIEGKFVWTDGTDTTFKNWAGGQPIGGGGSEDCVVLQLNGADSGKWADTTCNLLLRSIVRVSLCMMAEIQDTSVCLNDSVQLASIVTDGSSSYTFNWSPASADSIFKVSPLASTRYNLTVTDRYGCTATDTAYVRLDSLPTFDFGPADTICIGDSIDLSLGTGYSSYLWSNTATNNANVARLGGTYWGRRTDANGCSYTDTFKLTNFNLPSVSLGQDTTVCLGDTAIILSPLRGSNYTIKWHDNSTDSIIRIWDSTTVLITITDSNGCSNSDVKIVSESVKSSENIGNDTTVCKNTTLFFSGLSTGSLYDRWIINYGEPGMDTLEAYSISNDTANSLVYFGKDIKGCPAYDTIRISYDTIPIVQLINDTSICFGDSILVDAGPGMRSYTWTNGDTTQEIKVGATNSFRVFVEDMNGCLANANFILGIDSLPEFNILRNGFLGDTSICTNDSVQLTVDTLSSYTYSWNGSPFTLGDDSNYVNSVSQNIVIIKDSNACVFIDTLNVSLDTLPLVNIRTDTTICVGDSILLRVNSDTNYLHIWDGINMGKLDSMLIKNDTTYIVELVDRNTTCRATDSVRIQHDTLPIISIGGDTTFCFNDAITLDAGAKMFSYVWSTTDTTQIVKYTSPGIYTVDVVDSNGCKTSATRKVFMSQLPTPNLGPDIDFCKGSVVNEILNAGGGYSLYEWSTPKTGDSTLAQRDTVTLQGTYMVTVTDSIGCKGIDTIVLNANFLPTIELGADTFFCAGDDFNFLVSAGPGYKKYEWIDFSNFPTLNTLPSTGQILLISDTAASVFCRITDINGCTNQDTISIVEMPLPVVDLGVTDFYCEGDLGTYVDTLLADEFGLYKSYQWSTGDTNDTLIVTKGGVYGLTVTANNGCVNSTEKEIIEIPQPTIDFSADSLYCVGAPVILDAYTDGYISYSWYKISELSNIEDEFLNPILEPIDSGYHDTTISKFSITEPGKFKVIINYGQYPGCSDSAEAEIRQDIKPVIDFGIRNPDTTLCLGERLTLQPNFEGKGSTTENMIFEWQDGVADSVYTAFRTGLYQFVMSNDCGADIQDIQVNFEDCSNLWIPNSFTPNDDNDNDLWGVKSLEGFFEFRLQVFDNMGRMVWETTLPEIEWDGTHITNGKPQPIGTYVYRLTYRSNFDLVEDVNSAPTKEVTGQIHLFR